MNGAMDIRDRFSSYSGFQELDLAGVEYRDGALYCTSCGERVSFECESGSYEEERRMHDGLPLRYIVRCSCREGEDDTARTSPAMRDNKLRETLALDREHASCSFAFSDLDDADASFRNAYMRCKAYACHFDEVERRGLGIFISGAKGTGKTHLASCIANDVIDRWHVQVRYTGLQSLLEGMRNDKAATLSMLRGTPLLIIDNMSFCMFQFNGTDRQDQGYAFEVMDARCGSRKPTVFVSELRLDELRSVKGLGDACCDRIMSMSHADLRLSAMESWRDRQRRKEMAGLPF